MPKALQSFIHMDWNVTVGDELPDDHPLCNLRPDLFDIPTPEPDPEPDPNVRIRGPLVNPKSKKKEG